MENLFISCGKTKLRMSEGPRAKKGLRGKLKTKKKYMMYSLLVL